MNNNGLNIYDHNDKNVDSFIDRLNDINLESSYYLILLVGPYQSGKKDFLRKLENKSGPFEEIDLRDIISLNPEESYRKIDEKFKYIGETEKNLILRNGDVLAGEYTGFTYSSVRYATPQEKYLLNKIKKSEKIFVIDILEFENIDKSLQRFAQTAVEFRQPTSFLGKLFWKFQQIRINGHTFANKRPSATGL